MNLASNLRSLRHCASLLVLLSLVAASTALGANARLLILHTNDLHDHLRPGAYAQGGLPYVAGYIQQVRAGRKDVLVLDAGDVTEKGDMVAFMSQHQMTYEALRRIGYDAVAIGNHDDDAGVPALHAYEKVLGQRLLCLNLVKPDGTPEFLPSRVVQVGELKVGIIGLIVPRKEGSLNFEDSGRALAREAVRLRKEVHLVIALCHEGARKCVDWARMAPAVDVFVTGHTHEVLAAPAVVPETGAYIVQAGYYARWVGRLELTVNLETKKVIEVSGEVVPLMHDRGPVDAAMLAWVRQREQELCPEAGAVIAQTPEELGLKEVAWLGAAALRQQAKAEVGFCHAGQIIRSPIFAGPVDVNALFLAGGDRGNATVRTELTGAEITAYLNALATEKKNQTNWSGFQAAPAGGTGESGRIETDLEPERTYTVIMPELEWSTRFLRLVADATEKKRGGPLTARLFAARPATDVSFTGAMRSYLEQLAAAKRSLKEEADQLFAAASERAVARTNQETPDHARPMAETNPRRDR